MEYKMYGPTRQLFGAGVLNRLHRQKFPGNNALLVISSGTSLKSSGTLERIETQLDQAGIGYILFDQVQSNPLKSTVMEGAALARREHCDFVLAAGGGSVMDAGKVIAQMAVNPGDAWDYVFGGTGGRKKAPHRALPVVCITTTAGTGSEVDQWAVITNE